MGWIERVRLWLRGRPSTRPAPGYPEPSSDDAEDEEIAELVAIGII